MAYETTNPKDAKRLNELRPRDTTETEKCDILFRLAGLAEQAGGEIGRGPADILLRGEDTIEITSRPDGRNIALMAPEVIRVRAHAERPAIEEPQRWFLLGMLAYYLYYGADYYVSNHISLLDLESFLEGRSCVIREAEASRIPFAGAVSIMTAVQPGTRREGVEMFRRYLFRHEPGSAQVHFLLDGREVHQETYNLKGRDYENIVRRDFIFRKGQRYNLSAPVQVRYRPGIHRYDAAVTLPGFETRRDSGTV